MARLSLLRTCLSVVLLGLALGAPAMAWAEDGGTDPDGGVFSPDASVGGGGADRDNPEGDDNTGRVVSAAAP